MGRQEQIVDPAFAAVADPTPRGALERLGSGSGQNVTKSLRMGSARPFSSS